MRGPEGEIDREWRGKGGVEIFSSENGGEETIGWFVRSIDVRHGFGGFTARQWKGKLC